MRQNDSYIDSEEKALAESLESIDLARLENDTVNSKRLQKAAKAYLKKEEAKMNIRISTKELAAIKARAEQEGLKYQTFIKSILHKYITGQLIEANRTPAP